MTEIINLNKTRKAKARSAKEQQAAQNRVAYGQTKQEKQTKKQEATKASKLLDGHIRETE